MSDPERVRPVVTLVHGTNARGAAWTQPVSEMWRELSREQGVEVRRFDWSGKNNMLSRVEAGRELADDIAEARRDWPLAKQYVVAHSHAGNVALYASRKVEIDGIACLATPFLHVAQRNSALLTDKALKADFLGTLTLITWLAASVIGLWWPYWLSDRFKQVHSEYNIEPENIFRQ